MLQYFLVGMAAVSVLALGMFVSVASAHAEGVTVNVMTHICDEDIQSVEDFDNVDGPDENSTTQFHDKVLACPTVVMDGDEYADGAIHYGDHEDFNFVVEGDNGDEQDMGDADYSQMKLCESDVDFDVNGDGDISEDTCLGTSLYSFTDVDGGDVEVTEVDPPEGTRPGALEFTPDALAENDDADTLVGDMGNVFGEGDHSVMLDTMDDDDDNVITLHIYNFQGEDYNDEDSNDDDSGDSVTIDEDLFDNLLDAIGGLIQIIAIRNT